MPGERMKMIEHIDANDQVIKIRIPQKEVPLTWNFGDEIGKCSAFYTVEKDGRIVLRCIAEVDEEHFNKVVNTKGESRNKRHGQ
jgi:hypothetical protein